MALPASNEMSGLRQLVTSLTGERLFGIGVDGRMEPRLVERWASSPDGLEWTFSLREHLTFHDGSPVTADAVRRILERELARPLRSPGLLDVVGMDVVDDRTLLVRLQKPSTLLVDDLGGYSLSFEAGGREIGTGPFVADPGTSNPTILHAFERFFAGPPALRTIELHEYPTVRTAWTALMRDEIDALYEVGRDALEFVEAESSVRVYSFSRPFVQTLGFNLAHPILRQLEVRRALNYAVDREAVVRRVLHGRGQVSEGYVWPYHWAYDHDVRAYDYSPDEARRLLDEAGHPVKDGPGMPARFSLRCLVPADVSPFERLSLVVQKNLFDVGVDLILEPVPFTEIVKRLAGGDFESFLFEMTSPRTFSWPYRFLHSPPAGIQPLLNWSYASADVPLDGIRHAKNDDDLRAAVSALQRTLHDDPPAVFISWDERARAVSRRFEVPERPGFDVFNLLWQWKVATTRTTD